MNRDRDAFEAWLEQTGSFTDWSRDKTSESNPYHKPLVERTWQAWQASARIAIEALLEPTPAVVSAVAFYHIQGAGGPSASEMDIAKRAWVAGITAALRR